MVADAVRRHTEYKGRRTDMTWSMDKYADFTSGTIGFHITGLTCVRKRRFPLVLLLLMQ